MSEVAVLAYNAGNTLSVVAALKRLGANPVVTSDKELLSSAERIIFPGVGHAAPAAAFLRNNGLEDLIKNLQQPFLGICLGMQLMCDYSEEGDTKGFGIFKTNCCKFDEKLGKVPHIGWNKIQSLRGSLFQNIENDSFTYFVHSFRVPVCDQTSATCLYGESFSAALSQHNFYGVQFHPEKSASIGQKILENFLRL